MVFLRLFLRLSLRLVLTAVLTAFARRVPSAVKLNGLRAEPEPFTPRADIADGLPNRAPRMAHLRLVLRQTSPLGTNSPRCPRPVPPRMACSGPSAPWILVRDPDGVMRPLRRAGPVNKNETVGSRVYCSVGAFLTETSVPIVLHPVPWTLVSMFTPDGSPRCAMLSRIQ